MNYEEIVHQRRAINFFDPQRDVSEKDLHAMVALAARAPSSFNLQPWNLMVLREAAEKMRLRQLAWDQPKVSEAPVVLIMLADKNGWQEGHPTVEKNWQAMREAGQMAADQREWFLNAAQSLYDWNRDANLAFAVKNTGFFAMALMFAATSLGLETHPMDGFDHEGVREAFRIPDNYWIPLLLAVGYPQPGVDLQPPKWRKTFDEIVVTF